MSIERRLAAVPSQLFTLDGTDRGILKITDAYLDCLPFKVKQKVIITATGEENLELEIKRIEQDGQTIHVGPRRETAAPRKRSTIHVGTINTRTDISAYTVAKGAAISAEEQNKPLVPEEQIERATYETEPTVARRVFNVDQFGVGFKKTNPFPVTITGVTPSVPVGVQITHLDDDPNTGDVHDSTRIGDGTNLAEVTACKNLRTVDTLHKGGTNKIIEVDDTPVKIEVVSGTPKADRKTVFARPLAKGVHWGFLATITADETTTGGDPLGKKQPLVIAAEANTDVYLVGPASKVKVFIAES